MSRRRGSLAGSPLLIGALTTLIIVVAVYISYNANNGLPFTPTYDIKVELPEASNLEPGNQVRLGGARVGIVEKIVPYQSPRNGRLAAIASLKLEKSVGPLPANTKAIVQSVSSVGLKYLELERGESKATIPQGGTIPVSQTRQPVDIGEFFDMFNKKTRVANQQNLTNYGNGFAGRGVGLNEAIGELKPLLNRLVPVMRNLDARGTALANLFPSLDRAAREVAPVAEQQGKLYTALDTFFGAWAKVAPSLEASIQGGPAALHQATRSLAYEAPFMRNSAEFMRLLRPSAEALSTAAPPLSHAFEAGARTLAGAQSLNGEIASSSLSVQKFAENPIVELALEDLTHTATIGTPFVSALATEQVGCNYITLAFRNIASAFSESIGVGTLARASVVLAPDGPNAEGSPASAPANGGGPSLYADANHLHDNPYPNIATCEAGNEQYAAGQTVIGHAPKSHEAREFTKRSEDLFGEPYASSSSGKDLPTEEAQASGGAKPASKHGKKAGPPAKTGRKAAKRKGRR